MTNDEESDARRWAWLAANGFSADDVAEIRAATLERRAWRAEQRAKAEKKLPALNGTKARPSRDPRFIKRTRKAIRP
jgi:hypothetical protein